MFCRYSRNERESGSSDHGSVSSSGGRGGRGRDTSLRDHEGGPRGGSARSRSPVRDGFGRGAWAQGSRDQVHAHGRGGGGFEGFGRVGDEMIAELRRQLHEATQSLAVANRNAGVKDLTVSQMNDLIVKNQKLKKDLGLEKQSGGVLRKSHAQEVELLKRVQGEELGKLKKEIERLGLELTRRLGSKDYNDIVKLNTESIQSTMDDATKDIFEQIVDFGQTDRNAVKLSLGLLQRVSPGAKIAFSKAMFAMESASVRKSVYLGLGHLVDADRVKDGFVKEVLMQDEAEQTPVAVTTIEPKTPVKRVKVVPDPSSVDNDVREFMTQDNMGCKVVRVKDTNILAVYGDGRRNCMHKMFMNVRGVVQRMKCLVWRKPYEINVTPISPVTIVGPRSHDKLGRMVWVCREHWEVSVAKEANDEEACELAALDQESIDAIEASPVLTTLKTRRRLKFAAAVSTATAGGDAVDSVAVNTADGPAAGSKDAVHAAGVAAINNKEGIDEIFGQSSDGGESDDGDDDVKEVVEEKETASVVKKAAEKDNKGTGHDFSDSE